MTMFLPPLKSILATADRTRVDISQDQLRHRLVSALTGPRKPACAHFLLSDPCDAALYLYNVDCATYSL